MDNKQCEAKPGERLSLVSSGDGGNSSLTSPPASRRRYRRKLSNLKNVRCALADVVREIENNERDPKTAGVLIYGLQTLAGIIEKGAKLEELTERVTRIEEGVAARRGP